MRPGAATGSRPAICASSSDLPLPLGLQCQRGQHAGSAGRLCPHLLQVQRASLAGGAARHGRGTGQRSGQWLCVAAQLRQRLHGCLAAGTVMPDGRQFAQRLEEAGRQQQHEQRLAQRERPAPAAEGQMAQQVKAHIDGHHGHAQGREQLQYCR
jgi:hypothetical protein